MQTNEPASATLRSSRFVYSLATDTKSPNNQRARRKTLEKPAESYIHTQLTRGTRNGESADRRGGIDGDKPPLYFQGANVCFMNEVEIVRRDNAVTPGLTWFVVLYSGLCRLGRFLLSSRDQHSSRCKKSLNRFYIYL